MRATLKGVELTRLLWRERCACGCGRHTDTVVGPRGWRSRALPDDRARWRVMASQCAQDERTRSRSEPLPPPVQ
jgi:hypothetical protein